MILTMLNQKGGVGKTTLAYHLGGSLAKAGRRVCLVDNDPQSSLTQGAFGPDAAARLGEHETLAAVYSGQPIEPIDLVRPLPCPGLSILPNSGHSVAYTGVNPHRASYEDQTALRDALGSLRGAFEVILIDCPPNLYGCTWAALAASDSLVIPVQLEDYGIQGLTDVERSIRMMRAVLNPALETLGIIASMVESRRAVHQIYERMLVEAYGELVFTSRIPRAADFPEATMRHQPLAQYKPRCAAAKALDALAAEVLGRIERSTARKEVA